MIDKNIFLTKSETELKEYFKTLNKCPKDEDSNSQLSCNAKNLNCSLCWRNHLFNQNCLTLKELLNEFNFMDVWEKLLECYPDSHKESYEYTWNQLQTLESKDKPGFIIINHVIDDLIPEEIEEYEDVSGSFFEEQELTYSLMFVDWREWLGMKVDNFSLQKYGKETFLAHCLWEMTFLDFDNLIIDEEREKMEQLDRDLNDPEKFAQMKFIPLDEVIKKLEEK